MIPDFQVLGDHVFDGLDGHVDLVLSLLLGNEESGEGELFVGLELLLGWLEAEDFLVLLRNVDLVRDLSLGEIGNLIILFRAHPGEGRREVQPSLVFQLQIRLSADSHEVEFRP